MPQDDVYVNLVTETKKSVANLAKYAVGITAAIAVVKKLVNTAKKMKDAYFVQEQAEMKLSAAIKATGRSAEMSIGSLTRMASSLQKVTIYGDEATISAMAMLQQLGNLTQEGLENITPAVLDFASAMNIDLQTAASLVGKTLGSTTNALTRYGVEIDMTGTKEERLANLTQGLTDKFGGMAEAMGDTAYAADIKLKNALGDLAESMGGLISVESRGFIELLTSMTEKLKETAEGLLAYRKVIDGIARDKPRGVDEVATDIDTLQKSIAHLNSELDRGLGRKFLEGGLIGSSIRDAVLNKRLKAQQQQLEYLQLEQRGLGILAKMEAETDAAKKVALEIEATLNAEKLEDMKALLDAYAATAEGQEAALLAQIAYFDEFKKGPMAVAVLKGLREEYENLYGTIAAGATSNLYGPRQKPTGFDPYMFTGQGEGATPSAPGMANAAAFPFTEGGGGATGTKSSAMAAYRSSLESIEETFSRASVGAQEFWEAALASGPSGKGNAQSLAEINEQLLLETDALQAATEAAQKYVDITVEAFSAFGAALAEGATGWEAFAEAGKSALIMVGLELVKLAAVQAAVAWAKVLNPVTGAAHIPEAIAWTALAAGGGAAVGFAGAMGSKRSESPTVVVNVAGSIRSDLEIEAIIANTIARSQGVN